MFASGERQISKAVKKVGVKRGGERFAFIFFDVDEPEKVLTSLNLIRNDDVLGPSAEKALRFGVGPEEIRAVPPDMIEDLVLERVAFVALQK